MTDDKSVVAVVVVAVFVVMLRATIAAASVIVVVFGILIPRGEKILFYQRLSENTCTQMNMRRDTLG